jgi:hypothetical protein
VEWKDLRRPSGGAALDGPGPTLAGSAVAAMNLVQPLVVPASGSAAAGGAGGAGGSEATGSAGGVAGKSSSSASTSSRRAASSAALGRSFGSGFRALRMANARSSGHARAYTRGDTGASWPLVIGIVPVSRRNSSRPSEYTSLLSVKPCPARASGAAQGSVSMPPSGITTRDSGGVRYRRPATTL